ncbi:MAG: glycosyltransferase family 39 protein [Xanthomonadaceae bacterium]|nr:glycosyltransferase family 39 protein [Xanthomonadaceae bacterium]MDE3072923.1 glycosyltransferase family 39 protein [Pseudomonadota bacterium]
MLLALACLRLLLQVLLDRHYGFHRDELAVLADARHLAWGYVAYPPLTPFFGRIELVLFGTSLAGFRFFSALAQCVAMLLAGLIARDMGGRRGAQLVAAVATACMPFSLLVGSEFMYVTFDFLWWVLLAWLVVRLLNSGNPRWWLAIGLVVGLGMLTRYTMLFCVAGLVAGVLATTLRRQLASPWLWGGVALSLLLFLPNLLWQIRHDFVYLDFIRHIHARDVRIGRADGFFSQQLYANASLFTLPLWLGGLGFVMWAKDAVRYRLLAWLFLVPLALFALGQGRAYYMAPAYPMLLAAGAVAGERWLARLRPGASRGLRIATGILLALAATSSAAVALPLAPVNSIGWRISRAVQGDFAEQIGWRQLVAQVAGIYRALPAGERARTGVLANNYGEAGAIDLYGPALGLPAAISGVNSWWYRGYGNPPPTTLIVLGADPDAIRKAPADCTPAGRVSNRQGVANEETRDHPEIFVCRHLRISWRSLWPKLRSYG